jgi:ABC-type nickel/cobalt efflux system permease component RcnA
VFSLYLARKAPWWEPALASLSLALLHGAAAVVLFLILKGVTGAISAQANSAAIYLEGASYLLMAMAAAYLSIRSILGLVRLRRHAHDESTHGKKAAKLGLGALILSGAYPCPGAILVLVLALSLGLDWAGILAVGAMSLGMALPILAAAYLAWLGREGLFLGLKKREKLVALLSELMELAGYVLMLGFSLWLGLPFLGNFL